MTTKTAFVYYLEYTNDDSIYINLLKESIRSLIDNNYCKGNDIFVNVIGYSGSPIWEDNKYSLTGKQDEIKVQLSQLREQYDINIIDISEDRLHYVELPVLVNLPLPIVNDTHTYESKDTTRLKIFNHKFTSFKEIIDKGYDRIIQIDADLIFYKQSPNIFDVPTSSDPDEIYMCRFNSILLSDEIDNNTKTEYIKNCLNDREHNNTQLFSLKNTPETRNKYNLAKNFLKGSIDYNLDNLVEDICNQKFWVSGGVGIFSKAFIEKHFVKLSFINYFFTKDDEIALMIYCFANKIKLSHLDPDYLISYGRRSYDANKHVAYHPCGDNTIKAEFIENNFIPI
jgi:hypothetical protein